MTELHILHEPTRQIFLKTIVPFEKKLRTEPSLETLKKTAFSRKAERFHYQYLNNPGPGAYESNFKEKHSSDYHLTKQPTTTIPKHHQWIISKGRQPFQMKQSSPQSYHQQTKDYPNKGSQSNWGKNKRFNYEKAEKKSYLGPGKYTPESIYIKQRSHTLQLHKRASPKKYLETLINDRRSRRKISELEEIIGSKVDEFNQPRQSPKVVKATPSPVFKSKIIRFSEKQQAAHNLGPGSYNLETSTGQTSKRSKKSPLKLTECTKSPTADSNQHHLNDLKSTPGPGSYDLDSSQQDSSHKKAVLGLMLKQQRFTNSKKSNIPGPGQYMKKRFIHLNVAEFQKHLDPLSEKNHTFGVTDRPPIHEQFQTPFGGYNLNHHDISQRLLKQRQYYQRTKQFKLILPVSAKRP